MVLVTGRGDGEKAVVSAVVVRQIEPGDKKRLRFGGTVKFSDPVKRHIRGTLLPIVDNIAKQFGLREKCFEISGVNLGAASVLGVGVSITGLSADLPIFIAMLSTALQVVPLGDFIATGHIASPQGDITAVKGIPAKLEAAVNDGSIRRFICPSLREDASLKALSPSQRSRDITALMAVRDAIHTKTVRDIDELIREVFAEEAVLLASLKEGFFDVSAPQSGGSDPVSRALNHFVGANEKRFWNALQRYFSTGEAEQGKRLLEAYAAFFIRRRRYPNGFGARLFQLICAVPPQVRRLKIKFPILDRAICATIDGLAQQDDYDDVPLLYDAALGRHLVHRSQSCKPEEPLGTGTPDADCTVFDTIISMINEQALAREIGVPVDSARASYTLPSSTVDTYAEFLDILEAFYIHLKRYIGGNTAASDIVKARSEAIALLEETFRNRGRGEAAFAQARDGTEGGMRAILDAVTEQYKTEEQAKHVLRIFKDAMSEMEWEEEVHCIRGAMKRLGPLLPAELRNEPAERFVKNWEAIVRAYVQSSDRFGQLLRTM